MLLCDPMQRDVTKLIGRNVFLSGCCIAQRLRCLGGRPSVSYEKLKHVALKESNKNQSRLRESATGRWPVPRSINQELEKQMPRARMLISRGTWHSFLSDSWEQLLSKTTFFGKEVTNSA